MRFVDSDIRDDTNYLVFEYFFTIGKYFCPEESSKKNYDIFSYFRN